MSGRRLRAVGPNESPRRERQRSIIEAVDAGDRLGELVATHRRIASAVQDEGTPARDLASLTRRQLEIAREIDSLKRHLAEEAVSGAVSEDEEWSEEAI